MLFSFLGVIDENTVFYQASYCLFYAIYLLFHIFFFLGASQVYRAGKAEKYASRAMSRLYMTAVYVVWAMDASAVPVHQQRGHRGRAANL